MNTHRALTLSSLLALTGCLFAAAPVAAQDTNCQPGDLFCAELRIGPGRAGVRIGGDATPPPPPPEPQPPTVIVQPQPPPPVVVQPQPEPPTVIVQPTYQPPPPQVVQQPVVVQRRVRQRDRFPYSSMGVHLHLDGIAGQDLGMGGAGAGIRFRPNPHFALDIGGGLYGGVDYNGMDRVEVPLVVGARFFFNPQHRFQFYGLLEVGASVAHAEGFNVHLGRFDSRDYAHLGGGAGLGLEWRINRVFALNVDVRGFLRHRVDGNGQAEFTEVGEDGRLQSTDLSGGVNAQLGMTFYWPM